MTTNTETKLREALQALLSRYVGLVESGDAGNWDAEQEAEVINARAALSLPASQPVAGVWGWAVEDKHGVAQAIRPARKEFFGCVQSTEPFTAEDVAKMDSEWAGLAPHRIITLYTASQPEPVIEALKKMTDLAEQVSHPFPDELADIEAAKAIVANLPKREAMTWQPIATAPKDGTQVWAYCEGEQSVMHYLEGDGYGLWVYSDDLLSDACPEPSQPTHWIPRPANPEFTPGITQGGEAV